MNQPLVPWSAVTGLRETYLEPRRYFLARRRRSVWDVDCPGLFPIRSGRSAGAGRSRAIAPAGGLLFLSALKRRLFSTAAPGGGAGYGRNEVHPFLTPGAMFLSLLRIPRGRRCGLAGVAAIAAGSLVGAMTAIPAARAQVPRSPLPSAAGFAGDPVPPGSPIPRILPPVPPVTVPGPGPSLLPAPAEAMPARPVRVAQVSVEGATIYPDAELARFTQGLTGPAVTLTQIDAARQAILQRYRDDGYVLTTVSAVLDGQARLRFVITEGRIASVRLDGDIGPAGTRVLRFLQRLTESQPIDQATLERYLLLAQDVPGVSLQAVLQPSVEEPGALTLVAQVKRQAVSGMLTFDNRAFKQTGPVEGLATLNLNSFTEFGDLTQLSFYHTFPNSENFGQASTEVFVGDSGVRVRIYGGAGPTNPAGGVLKQLGYDSFTTVFGAQVSYPVIRARQQTLNVYLNFDGSDSTINTATGPGGGSVLQSFDAVRAVRVGQEYAWSDLWAGTDRSAASLFSVRLSQGAPILGASNNPNSLTAARHGEQADFTKVAFELNRTQTLAQLSESTSVAVMGLFTGQWSNSILPPVEQFYLGGPRLTRGYYAGQVTGDSALAATVELQLNTGFEPTLFGTALKLGVQFYGFYDWGETWQNVSTDPNARIASTGGGARVQVTQYTEFDLEGLARLNTHPAGQTVNASGVYWRVLTRF
jgi:hemolysin activation/secretion protein